MRINANVSNVMPKNVGINNPNRRAIKLNILLCTSISRLGRFGTVNVDGAVVPNTAVENVDAVPIIEDEDGNMEDVEMVDAYHEESDDGGDGDVKDVSYKPSGSSRTEPAVAQCKSGRGTRPPGWYKKLHWGEL